MKKNLILLTICFFSALKSFSQEIYMSYDHQYIQTLIQSEIYIVMTGNEPLDQAILSAMKKHWTFTSFKTVNIDELGKHVKDTTKFFMVNKFTLYNNSNVQLEGLLILRGGEKNNDKPNFDKYEGFFSGHYCVASCRRSYYSNDFRRCWCSSPTT